MAKVTITIEDQVVNGFDAAVTVFTFDPPITDDTRMKDLSKAQSMSVEIAEFLKGSYELTPPTKEESNA